jgi:hypothetical protein
MLLLAASVMTGLLFLAPPDSATTASIKETLEGFLSQPNLKQTPEALPERLDALRLQSVAQVQEILPVTLSLLRSENPSHQEIGTMAFIAIALRQDSAELLGPHIPELVTLLETHDRTHSGTALGLLTLLNPKPPVSLVPYLLPRLADGNISTEKLAALSRTLLRAAPNDPSVVGAILNLLQEHPSMRAEMVQMMGAAQTVNERAIAFLGASLADEDADVRLMAVQAVARQGTQVIQRFEKQLGKIALDPDEQSSTRDFASMALKQLGGC